MKNDNNNLALIGRQPISDTSPCGENIRYESVFEELEAELAKQESLNAETVDWNRVNELSVSILKNSSKDLLVAAYLCQSLLLKDGYSGLSVGMNILADIVEKYWDCLFPPAKRMRARTTAIAWLAEKAGVYLQDHPPKPEESEYVVTAFNAVKKLDNELIDKMGDQAPMLTDLSRPLKNYKQSAEAELAKVEKASTEPQTQTPADPQGASETSAAEPRTETRNQADPAPAPSPISPPPAVKKSKSVSSNDSTISVGGTVESDNDAKKILRQIQDAGRKTVGYWQSKTLSDPKPYRIARLLGWLMIDILPPANDGVTQVNPPAAERLKYFDLQIEKSEYATVLPELEQTLARSPFWLDGQFKVISVLRALGGAYEPAAKTVIRETRSFIERLPGIENLSFSDQTPFASDQTKMWLESEVMVANESAATAGGNSTGSSACKWDLALAEAKKKVASGSTEEAMSLFEQGIKSASQVRDQFYWRCALAELMLQTGKAAPAAGVLEQMAVNATDYNLAEWEPELMSRIYLLLFKSYRKQQGKKKEDATINDLVERVYEQLCWFDPVSALTMKEG